MTAIIEVCDLSKWFGEVVALNNLSFTIGSGVTGLLGPNGAGKSTFIKLALGLYTPGKGSIKVFGMLPRHNMKVLKRIGYCPETDHFFDNMTGFEFVYWLNRISGLPKKTATERAEMACERVQMTEWMHKLITQYSKGMRQRIKIAQTLSTGPELIFLDEPMNGLDPQGREEMFGLIQQLGEDGLTIILSSHILYEIERVTSNVVLFYQGTLLAQGRVRDIRDLIDDHPHTITIQCSSPQSIARTIAELSGTMSIEYNQSKTGLQIRTADPNMCYATLNNLALDRNYTIDHISCSDDNLQSVFDYLVRQ